MKSIIDNGFSCDCLFVSHKRGFQRLFHRAPDSRGRAFAQVCLALKSIGYERDIKLIIIPNPGEDLGQACFQALGFSDRADLWSESMLLSSPAWRQRWALHGSESLWHFSRNDAILEAFGGMLFSECVPEFRRGDQWADCDQNDHDQRETFMAKTSKPFLVLVGSSKVGGRCRLLPAIFGCVAENGDIVGVLGFWGISHQCYDLPLV